MDAQGSKFAREREVYDLNRQRWLVEGRSGHFAVIKGDEILGVFDDAVAAFEAGLGEYGEGEFFMSSIFPSDATNISFL